MSRHTWIRIALGTVIVVAAVTFLILATKPEQPRTGAERQEAAGMRP